MPGIEGSGTLLTIADRRLGVRLTRGALRLEERHIDLARAISAEARAHGAVADRAAVQEVQLAIAGNRTRGNGVGINLDGGQDGSTGDHIANNDTSRNLAAGLVVANNASDNIVFGNVSNANQGAPGEGGGIVLFVATDNTVRGNVANGNLDVGIGVFEDQPGDSTGNVLTANVANANRAHGISAVDGTVDGGGNTAHGNTPLPNCLGVSCT